MNGCVPILKHSNVYYSLMYFWIYIKVMHFVLKKFNLNTWFIGVLCSKLKWTFFLFSYLSFLVYNAMLIIQYHKDEQILWKVYNAVEFEKTEHTHLLSHNQTVTIQAASLILRSLTAPSRNNIIEQNKNRIYHQCCQMM